MEVKKKASHPIGQLGVDAFGKKQTYVDRGERTRALVAVGRADYGEISDLVPTIEGMEVIGLRATTPFWILKMLKSRLKSEI